MEKNSGYKHRPRNYDWYSKLKKPRLTPPPWFFGVIWTFLYTCIVISGFTFLQATKFSWTKELGVYLIQLFFNFIWTPLFFWYKMPKAALVDVTLLLASIALNIYYFQPISPISAYLLYPYFAWVCVAFYINFYIVSNNPDPTQKTKSSE